MDEFLKDLNESQRAAVEYCSGPSLVIAGAGSGKTRVLTYKIAYLLSVKRIRPYTLLALTFTNKAAREMRERIARIVDGEMVNQLWMGTFHSVFARILRVEAKFLDYPSNYTIYDSSDSKSLVRAIIKEMGLDDKVYKANLVQSQISNAKNALVTPQVYAKNTELLEADKRRKIPLLQEIYRRYQIRCKKAGAMDFDDLLLNVYLLFRDFPEIRLRYAARFQYVLVDEYQDTNYAQHLIIQQLTEENQRVCVVGDDAQSIYSFRGANIDNILNFKKLYKDCQIFKLERNYRSTKNIVEAANSLIDKNHNRIDKKVYSEKERGRKIIEIPTYSDYEEAHAVARLILNERDSFDFKDMAILYRTNAQSRVLEETLRKQNISYRIYGGLSFYQRKEIKDIVSYFRVIANPHDEEALKRIINYPKRGIGNTTVNKIIVAAIEKDISLWQVLQDPLAHDVPVNKGTLKKLIGFRDLILRFIEIDKKELPDIVAELVAKETGIFTALSVDTTVEGKNKFENFQELINGVVEFVQMKKEEGLDKTDMGDFLAEIALLTDQDKEEDGDLNKLSMMTVHASKGLEFPVVFVVGMEENLFPSMMAKENPLSIEEERRLFYVAITRAEQLCVLSYAKSRFRNGSYNFCNPSQFLKDIDNKYLDVIRDGLVSIDRSKRRSKDILPSENNVFQAPLSTFTETKEERSAKILTRVKKSSSVDAPYDPKQFGDLKIGSVVKHARFGTGIIKDLSGVDANKNAVIAFDSVGMKKLFLKFAKLEIVD